jgi:hypothetical protein
MYTATFTFAKRDIGSYDDGGIGHPLAGMTLHPSGRAAPARADGIAP